MVLHRKLHQEVMQQNGTVSGLPLPGDGDERSDGAPEAADWSGGLCHERRLSAHPCYQSQRGLLAVLETAEQQQQVALLIHQRFPVALCSQVLFIQSLHLQQRKTEGRCVYVRVAPILKCS